MRPSNAAPRRAASLALMAALTMARAMPAGAAAAPPGTPGDLDALRQQSIAAGRETQQQEQAIAALEHEIDLFGRDADARRRGLDESRAQQEHLLGALELVQRNAPDRVALLQAGAIDRRRGELLIEGTIPALRAEAHALADEIARTAGLHQEIAAKQDELAVARDTLGRDRRHLAELAARRVELTRRLLPEAAGGEGRLTAVGREAGDIADLIKRTDAAIDRRDKQLLAQAHDAPPQAKAGGVTANSADPTRPGGLRAFGPPHSVLTMPVSGAIERQFGAADAGEAPAQGLGLATLPGAAIVAPFDGRITYAARFRDLGVVLIIRHGDGYHSVLAGVGRVAIGAGEWVLAGEPVGSMPDAVDKTRDGPLYFELRRNGRPVDPQPWLATRDDRRDQQDGDQKVRE